jgi:nicotinate-nucleotide pyrophosphorylase (carboxylating)
VPTPPAPPGPAAPLDRRAARDVEIDRIVRNALDEDRGGGDLTSFTAVPEKARARATLIAKGAGVLAGLPVFARTFELCDRRVKVELVAKDGSSCKKGDVVARVEGSARALLLAERTALNFIQRLSGTATLTAKFVRLRARPSAPAPDRKPRASSTRARPRQDSGSSRSTPCAAEEARTTASASTTRSW